MLRTQNTLNANYFNVY